MLLNQDEPTHDLEATGVIYRVVAALSVAALGAVLVRAVLVAKSLAPAGTLTDEKIASLGGNMKAISEQLFTDRIFHFELTSFLLLGAIVATVTLAKRNSRGEGEGV
jgi:NADH:ubiquinone oxidoreductase subunit 6 (subunit J)